MFRFLTAMFRSPSASKRPASPSRASFRPQLEGLEERALLSVTPLIVTTNTRMIADQANINTNRQQNLGQANTQQTAIDLQRGVPGGQQLPAGGQRTPSSVGQGLLGSQGIAGAFNLRGLS
jgi:hypothetical protein